MTVRVKVTDKVRVNLGLYYTSPQWWRTFTEHAFKHWRQSSENITVIAFINREPPPGFKFEFAEAVDQEILIAPSEAELTMFILKWMS